MGISPVTHSLPELKHVFEAAYKIINFHVFRMAVTIVAQTLKTFFLVRGWTLGIKFKCQLCWEKPFTKSLFCPHDFLKSKRKRGTPGFEKIHPTLFNQRSLISKDRFQIIVNKKEC